MLISGKIRKRLIWSELTAGLPSIRSRPMAQTPTYASAHRSLEKRIDFNLRPFWESVHYLYLKAEKSKGKSYIRNQ